MNLPLWFSLALLTGLTDIAYNFASRKFLRVNGNPIVFSWWFSLVRALIFGVLSFFISKNQLPQLNIVLLLLALGVANSLNIYLFMRMHTLTELSLSSIVVQLRIVWVPLFALLLVSEVLHISEYFGVVLLFAGVLILRSLKKLIVDKSVNTALVFSITTSILTVMLKIVSTKVPTETIIFFMSAPAVVILPLFLRDRSILFYKWREDLHQKLIVTFLSIANMYLFISALATDGPVSKVNAVVQIFSVFAGVTGVILLKERDQIFKKALAIGLAIAGIILVV